MKREKAYWIANDFFMAHSQKYAEVLHRSCVEQKSVNINDAVRFELDMYLFVRFDLSVFKSSQLTEVRTGLNKLIQDNITRKHSKKTKSNNLISVMKNRLDGYGSVLRKSNDVLERFHFCLVENIKRASSKNMVEIWDFEKGGIIIMDVFQEFDIKTCIIESELGVIGFLSCGLKHLFRDNNDFTELPEAEIVERLSGGISEAERLVADHYKKR